MIDLVGKMVREVNVPLHEAIAMATENPARAIGLETKGRLYRRGRRRSGCAFAANRSHANFRRRPRGLVIATSEIPRYRSQRVAAELADVAVPFPPLFCAVIERAPHLRTNFSWRPGNHA